MVTEPWEFTSLALFCIIQLQRLRPITNERSRQFNIYCWKLIPYQTHTGIENTQISNELKTFSVMPKLKQVCCLSVHIHTQALLFFLTGSTSSYGEYEMLTSTAAHDHVCMTLLWLKQKVCTGTFHRSTHIESVCSSRTTRRHRLNGIRGAAGYHERSTTSKNDEMCRRVFYLTQDQDLASRDVRSLKANESKKCSKIQLIYGERWTYGMGLRRRKAFLSKRNPYPNSVLKLFASSQCPATVTSCAVIMKNVLKCDRDLERTR